MYIQKTDWGLIEWMQSSDQEKNSSSFRIGKVHVDPGRALLPHIHYEEQFHYVLEGNGVCYVNGEAKDLYPGVMLQMPAGCTHEMINTSENPIVHLLVTSAAAIQQDSLIDLAHPSDADAEDLLDMAIQALRKQYLDGSHFPLVIANAAGRIVFRSERFPYFCEKNCSLPENLNCSCLNNRPSSQEHSENHFLCPYGLTLYQVPILWEDTCLGYLHGGFIRYDHAEILYGKVDEASDSNAYSLLQMLRKMASAISSFCEFETFRRNHLETKKSLTLAQKAQMELETDLRAAENVAANLRINHHFLFNTLNSMASMAIKEGSRSVYQSIVDLSRMLRYSVRVEDRVVPLRMELEFVEAYLKLQKIRFVQELEYSIKADKALEDWAVPFNFLQPIAENAFTHGFGKQKKKELKITIDSISVSGAEERIRIVVENNGDPIDRARCSQITAQFQSRTAHGMSMIYEKLRSAFQNDFEMSIVPGEGGGAKVTFALPFIKE